MKKKIARTKPRTKNVREGAAHAQENRVSPPAVNGAGGRGIRRAAERAGIKVPATVTFSRADLDLIAKTLAEAILHGVAEWAANGPDPEDVV